MKWYYKLLLIVLLIFPISSFAQDTVNVYLFHSITCPHCHDALDFFDELEKDEELKFNLYDYEITQQNNAYNRTLFDKVSELYNLEGGYVPLICIGNSYMVGFGENDKQEVIDKIKFYTGKNYKDEVGYICGVTDDKGEIIEFGKDPSYIINVPIIGEVELKDLSLPVISILIGLTDGFNPCAMWILIFLITMLFNMKDRKKMWILGLTFILTSGTIYYMFMMAWIKISDFVNTVYILRILVAVIAMIFGIINLYNYYKNRNSDGCTVVSKQKRITVKNSITRFLESKFFIFAIIGIILLATVVNLIELLCSLGLPVLFAEILSLNDLSENMYNVYMLIYIFFFLLDDILVFVISMITLKQTAFSTKYNKLSHLIGGIIMLLIGLLMLFKPEWLAFKF